MPIKIPDDLPATSVLQAEGVMVMREADAVHSVMGEFFGGTRWFPANTMVQVDNFIAPGARVQYDVIAAGPLNP